METRPHHHPRHRIAAVSLAALALAGASAAAAEPARALSLPAGPLHAALASLAAQTRQQLLYTPDLTQGRHTAGLSGRYTAEQALAQLLAAEDIQVARAGPGVLVLRRRDADGSTPGPPAVEGPASRPFAADGVAVLQADPSGTAARQTAGTISAAGAPATMDELRVTGTHIRGAGQGASPVLALDRQDLDRSGHATVAGALNALPQNFAAGGATEGTITTGADALGRNATYATGVNLRGLGSLEG
jgi:iron complex outermembrane receptor protein